MKFKSDKQILEKHQYSFVSIQQGNTEMRKEKTNIGYGYLDIYRYLVVISFLFIIKKNHIGGFTFV